MTGFRLSVRAFKVVSTLMILSVLIGGVVKLLLVRRQYFLQKAAFYEYRSRVGDSILLKDPAPGWVEFEEGYMARCAETAIAYRRAAKFPLMPEPEEPR